jgi:hypothetical protein
VEAIGGANQLRGDARALAGTAHAALQHRVHAKLLADAAQVLVLALELERRGAPDHLHAVDARERVQDLLGQAVGEELVLRIVGHVDEGQHGDRLERARLGRWLRGLRRRRRCAREIGRPPVLAVPDRCATRRNDQQQQDGLHPRRALNATLAVVPGQHQRGEEADHGHRNGNTHRRGRPAIGARQQAEHLQQHPGAGGVAEQPFGQLAFAQAVDDRRHVSRS